MKLSAFLPGGAAMLPAIALAFQPLVTDDTGTQGAGGNQVEASYVRTVDKVTSTRTVTQEVPLAYARGITDALDLTLGIGHQRIALDAPATTERGWGNPVLGAKWRFYDNEAGKLSFAIKPELQLPVSNGREARGLGTARASYSIGLLMTQETGFGAVHANLVAERANYADDALNAAERRTTYRVSAAPVWNVAGNWKLALDAGIMANPDRAAKTRMGYYALGAIYSPGKDLDVAFGILRNVWDGSTRTTQATAGLTWRFR